MRRSIQCTISVSRSHHAGGIPDEHVPHHGAPAINPADEMRQLVASSQLMGVVSDLVPGAAGDVASPPRASDPDNGNARAMDIASPHLTFTPPGTTSDTLLVDAFHTPHTSFKSVQSSQSTPVTKVGPEGCYAPPARSATPTRPHWCNAHGPRWE